MIHTKNPLYKTILILNLVFILPCAAANIYGLSTYTMLYGKLSVACVIVSLICAFIYIIKGYSKGQAKLYKAFEFFYILALFTSLFSRSIRTVNLVFEVAAFGLVVSLASAKDLGKTKSLVMCGGVVALELANFFIRLFGDYSGISQSRFYGSLFRVSGEVFIAIVLGICTFAKYVDKTARGTK